jgi:hypothetical protein
LQLRGTFNFPNMKKTALISILLLLGITLSGCGRQLNMDQLDTKQNVYHYKNETLGFQVDLPASFEYYQTQMKYGKNEKGEQTTDWRDVEFLVPARDRNYNLPQYTEVPGYAKAMIVRTYEKGKYVDQGFEKLIETDNRIYAVRFWTQKPQEWQKTWSPQDESGIKKTFKMIE